MKIQILFDLTNLFFTSRRLAFPIDYEAMLRHIKADLVTTGHEVEVHGFTIFVISNIKQKEFLDSLVDIGFLLHTYSTETAGSLLPDMLAEVIAGRPEHFALVTNEPAAKRVAWRCEGEDAAIPCTLVYFGNDVPEDWCTAALNKEIDFLNLSEVGVFESLRLTKKEVPIKKAEPL